MPELETRYYIGITDLGKTAMKMGPNNPEDFKLPLNLPITMDNGYLLFPVNEAVYEEWSRDEDDDEPEHDYFGTPFPSPFSADEEVPSIRMIGYEDGRPL